MNLSLSGVISSNFSGKQSGDVVIDIRLSSSSVSDKFASRIDSFAKKKIISLKSYLYKDITKRLMSITNPEASKVGSYPNRINGHLFESIDVSLIDEYTVRVTTKGSRARRLAYLEYGFTLPEKTKGAYAVPVSVQARKASSNGIGPREAFGELKFNKCSVTLFGRTRTYSILSTKKSSGKKDVGTVHYVLMRGPITVKSRKGLIAYVNEEQSNISQFLSSGWDKI